MKAADIRLMSDDQVGEEIDRLKKEQLTLAAAKLPIKTRFVARIAA